MLNEIIKIPISNSDIFMLVNRQYAMFFADSSSWMQGHYVYKWFNGKTYAAHRIIINAKKGELVDHINGDTIDNRISNLRITDQKTNTYNRHVFNHVSNTGYTGISFRKDRKLLCDARYGPDKKRVKTSIKNPVIGALLRDIVMASKYTSEKNALNFPENIHISELKEFIDNTNGKFFTIFYAKKQDGKLRRLVCRINVEKNLKGKGFQFEPSERALYCVYDVFKRNYRFINLDGAIAVVFQGKKYKITRDREKVTFYDE